MRKQEDTLSFGLATCNTAVCVYVTVCGCAGAFQLNLTWHSTAPMASLFA